GRGCDEHAERQGRSARACQLVAEQLVADLRAVAMHDCNAPARLGERDDDTQRLARVRELLVDTTVAAGRLERVASKRDDDRARTTAFVRGNNAIGSGGRQAD